MIMSEEALTLSYISPSDHGCAAERVPQIPPGAVREFGTEATRGVDSACAARRKPTPPPGVLTAHARRCFARLARQRRETVDVRA